MVAPLLLALAASLCALMGCHGLADVGGRTLDPDFGKIGDATLAELAPRPPARPDGVLGPSGKRGPIAFAMRTLYLGSIDPATDTANPDAWKQFGHDIDGKCTTAHQSSLDASGVCTKRPNAQELAHLDGDDCRDNTAGRLLAGSLEWLPLDFERNLHERSHAAQDPTYVLVLDDLDDGPDDPYVPARLYIAAPRGSDSPAPRWDGSDELAVDASSVHNGSVDEPRYVFPSGYVKNHIWVSSDFHATGMAIPLVLGHHAQEIAADTAALALQLDPTHTRVVRSTFSGVLSDDAVEAFLLPPFLVITDCDADAAKSLLSTTVFPNADLVTGHPSFTAAHLPCDRMSIGLDIEWRPVVEPTKVVDVPPSGGPCEPG